MHLYPHFFNEDLSKRTHINVMGIMSGTSADGTDSVVIRIALPTTSPIASLFSDRIPIELLGHHFEPYPEEQHARVIAGASDMLPISELTVLQAELAQSHAKCAKALLAQLGDTCRVDFASIHGQTIQHHPAQHATLQLCDPYVLSETIGCPVVFDHRRRDMAIGGQGAPLVPLTELWLNGRSNGRPVLRINLGGIANISYMTAAGTTEAWDLGPAMSLLDLAVEQFFGITVDNDGELAMTGKVNEDLLRRWLAHPYFAAPRPKSTGREMFGKQWIADHAVDCKAMAQPEDLLATLAAFTAAAMHMQLEPIARELLLRSNSGSTEGDAESGAMGTSSSKSKRDKLQCKVSGGGAKHQRVMKEFGERTRDYLVVEIDHDFPSGAREAVSWALLGAASLFGVPGNVPNVTGAARAAVLGSWTFAPHPKPSQ